MVYNTVQLENMSRIARLEKMSHEASNSQTNSSLANHTEVVVIGMSEAERTFKIVFYCFLFILGSLGNFLVLVVVKGKPRRTITDCFIFNLAISDVTFLWLSLPFYTYELFKSFDKNMLYCKLIWPMMSIALSVSVFTLTSMAIERCRGILHPLRPRIKIQATLVWIAFIWLCALLSIMPLMVVARAKGSTCGENWPNISYRKTYTAVLLGLQCAVPLVIIAVAYIRIALSLVRSRKPMRMLVNYRGQVVKHKTKTENFQIIRTIAVIVFLFMACMLPNQIAWMLFDFGSDAHKDLSHGFWAFAEALMYLHACVNPIAYGSLARQFRRGYIRYLRYIFCCQKSAFVSDELSGNLTSERPANKNCTAIMVPNSMKCPSIINGTRSTVFEEQSSPNFSVNGQSHLSDSNSPTKSVMQEAASVEIMLQTSNENILFHPTFLNLSFKNSALIICDHEKSAQDTKL